MSAGQLRPTRLLRQAWPRCVSVRPVYSIEALPSESTASTLSFNSPKATSVSLTPPGKASIADFPALRSGIPGARIAFEIHRRECQRLRSNALIEAARRSASAATRRLSAPGSSDKVKAFIVPYPRSLNAYRPDQRFWALPAKWQDDHFPVSPHCVHNRCANG
jgi:hypothetical protein